MATLPTFSEIFPIFLEFSKTQSSSRPHKMEPLLCYNRGCGKSYTPLDNENEVGYPNEAVDSQETSSILENLKLKYLRST